jgi:hypothetical protein
VGSEGLRGIGNVCTSEHQNIKTLRGRIEWESWERKEPFEAQGKRARMAFDIHGKE